MSGLNKASEGPAAAVHSLGAHQHLSQAGRCLSGLLGTSLWLSVSGHLGVCACVHVYRTRAKDAW